MDSVLVITTVLVVAGTRLRGGGKDDGLPNNTEITFLAI